MQTVLVTGANRGLGLEFARQYHEAGWHVIAASRQPDEAAQTRAWSAELLQLDVRSEVDIRSLAHVLKGRQIDLLINNAGYHPGTQQLGQLDYSNWPTAFHVNAIAPLQIAEALLPLIPPGGKIINIGSRLGSIACNEGEGSYAYRATKAALHCITRSLAIDLAPKQILVAALHPGWVKTDMGTSAADIEVGESVSNMRNVIATLGSHNTGLLINYDGEVISW
ncbi:SDR family oxidoreductase [Bradyrhizobium vignae]|uniref:Short-chain dehydrogenase/reductase SDR n=1 Tax=Bradyrhizobium vignae TaxID=1549949 RepID=A0A2U3Q9J6_9BRAD|nr:SDR family oxidoreductase [Bradyrhizobium vignae]SPP98094.1 Short-chain dehydrogenase/reductase SDR [Bradyrhizobium vignae]